MKIIKFAILLVSLTVLLIATISPSASAAGAGHAAKFSIDISGDGTGSDSIWYSASGGGQVLPGVDRTTGKYPQGRAIGLTNPGAIEFAEITLSGPVRGGTDGGSMLDWYKAMQEKGESGDVYKNVTITLRSPDGTDYRTYDYLECWLTSYSLNPLDADEDDVLTERITIQPTATGAVTEPPERPRNHGEWVSQVAKGQNTDIDLENPPESFTDPLPVITSIILEFNGTQYHLSYVAPSTVTFEFYDGPSEEPPSTTPGGPSTTPGDTSDRNTTRSNDTSIRAKYGDLIIERHYEDTDYLFKEFFDELRDREPDNRANTLTIKYIDENGIIQRTANHHGCTPCEYDRFDVDARSGGVGTERIVCSVIRGEFT